LPQWSAELHQDTKTSAHGPPDVCKSPARVRRNTRDARIRGTQASMQLKSEDEISQF
jgi:hypothetical protein